MCDYFKQFLFALKINQFNISECVCVCVWVHGLALFLRQTCCQGEEQTQLSTTIATILQLFGVCWAGRC